MTELEGYTRTADLLFIGGTLHQLWVPGHPNTGQPVYLPVPSAEGAGAPAAPETGDAATGSGEAPESAPEAPAAEPEQHPV